MWVNELVLRNTSQKAETKLEDIETLCFTDSIKPVQGISEEGNPVTVEGDAEFRERGW